MIRHLVKADWNANAINYVLRTRRERYIKVNEKQPICLYCSPECGSLWPVTICLFAIRYGLRLVFMPKDKAGHPWIAFGEEHEEVMGDVL